MSSELRVKFPETISTMDDLDKVKVIYEEVFSIGLYMHKKDGMFTDTTGAIFIYKDDDRNHIIAFYMPEGDTFTLIEQPVILTDIAKVYGSAFEEENVPCIMAETTAGGEIYVYVKNGIIQQTVRKDQ